MLLYIMTQHTVGTEPKSLEARTALHNRSTVGRSPESFRIFT